MKVFMLQDVAKVGRRHEFKIVADGFGRNVLIPQGKALLVGGTNDKKIQEILSKDQNSHEAIERRAKVGQEKLNQATIKITAKANDQGHLFAAIKPTEIAKVLAEQGIVVQPEELILTEAVRTTGHHEITWHLGQVEIKFDLEIVAL